MGGPPLIRQFISVNMFTEINWYFVHPTLRHSTSHLFYLTRCLSSNDLSYNVRRATEEDRQGVLTCIEKWFFPHTPTTTVFNLRTEDGKICNDYKRYITKSIDTNPSWNVVAVSNCNIIGVMLNKELTREEYTAPYLPDGNNKNFLVYHKFWMDVRREANLFGQFPEVDKIFYLHAMCVDGKLRTNGISKALVLKSMDVAREEGFPMVMGECSSAYSANVLKELQYCSISTLKYEDYRINGKKVCKALPPHQSGEMLVKRL